MYMQRYIAHFPAAGEIIVFDRSWYNRAGVEYVMEFCTPEQHQRFLKLTPLAEKWMVESGIILIKIWRPAGRHGRDVTGDRDGFAVDDERAGAVG